MAVRHARVRAQACSGTGVFDRFARASWGVLSSLSPQRRRLAVAIGAAVIAALVALAAFAAVRLLGSDAGGVPAGKADVAQSRPGPVLLVPGYGGDPSSLRPLQAALEATGRAVTIVQLPGDAQGDLTEQARVLGAAADVALAGTDAGSIDVIGYSAGGVVARIWARDLGGAAAARRIVTLGSPHHGTALASLAQGNLPQLCPVACQQLAQGSAVLQQLNAGDETPPGPQWVSIWTTQDDVVLPADSAVLNGALNIQVQQVCADDAVRHGTLPSDPLVIGLTLLQLGAADTSAPGPDQCAALRAAG